MRLCLQRARQTVLDNPLRHRLSTPCFEMKKLQDLNPVDLFLIVVILASFTLAAIKIATMPHSDIQQKMESIPAPH